MKVIRDNVQIFCCGFLEIWSCSCIIPHRFSLYDCKFFFSIFKCANLIYSDPVTSEQIFQVFPYYDTLIIEIDLVVVEMHSGNYWADLTGPIQIHTYYPVILNNMYCTCHCCHKYTFITLCQQSMEEPLQIKQVVLSLLGMLIAWKK